MTRYNVQRSALAARSLSASVTRLEAKETWRITQVALLTLALSLPQGLLALPIALAQLGLAPGLLIIAGLGALNSLTVAWTAQLLVAGARHGTLPSLASLAAQHLGRWGRRLTVASSAALFFLALLASLVGLARSLQQLVGVPTLLGAAACGLLLLALTTGRASIPTQLLIGLGLLTLGLVVVLSMGLLQHIPAPMLSAPAGGSPLVMLGVGQMLFFAPMLVPVVAHQVLPRGGSARSLVIGSALGVTGGALLAALWASAVYRAVGAIGLTGSAGTVVPALNMATPATAPLASLLGFLLLGMTALRCALVLRALLVEHLPERLQGGHSTLLAHGPVVGGLVLALVLLCGDSSSFTTLIALAGGGAASLTSLVIPALLRYTGRASASGSPGRSRRAKQR